MRQDTALLYEIESANQDLEALLMTVLFDSALRPDLLGEWSARDLAAHFIGWQEVAIGVLSAIRDGAPVPSYEEDEDAFNTATLALS